MKRSEKLLEIEFKHRLYTCGIIHPYVAYLIAKPIDTVLNAWYLHTVIDGNIAEIRNGYIGPIENTLDRNKKPISIIFHANKDGFPLGNLHRLWIDYGLTWFIEKSPYTTMNHWDYYVQAQAPKNIPVGGMYFNTTKNKFEIFDGEHWNTIG